MDEAKVKPLIAVGFASHHRQLESMINPLKKSSQRILCGGAVLIFAAIGLIAIPVRADDAGDPKQLAVAAMQTWLAKIDQNHYAQSWTDASPSFQKAVSSEQWIADLNRVRAPLGRCTGRKLASAMRQTEVPSPAGPQKGDFVVAQFRTSFENLAFAVETVCFEKGSDGAWKASGYYVKPMA